MRRVLVLGVLAGCGPAKWRATPEQMSPLPPIPVPASRVGPLSLHEAPSATSWNDSQAHRRITENRYLDAERIRAEARELGFVIDTFYKPLTSEARIGYEQMQQSLATIERLAPYSISSVTTSYQQSGHRLNLCVMGAGGMGSCNAHELARTPRPTPTSAYQIQWAEPGIGMVVVHSLTTDAKSPQWRDFAADVRAKLGDARGLLLDLRDAAGDDPRALLPWVAKLSGRTDIKPLRAIERPDVAGRYTSAYEAKFADRGRDPQVWRELLGPSSPANATRRAIPITILVGRYCQSACELIARSLATYANATVIGSVTHRGRAARDEPALLHLPHSQSTVYFHATRYLFSEEIEAATGPSEAWSALTSGDGFAETTNTVSTPWRAVDPFAFAVKDIKYRIDHPQGWPRCDSLPTTNISNRWRHPHGCSADTSITLRAAAPASVIRRFLATCSPPVQLTSGVANTFWLAAPEPSLALLAQISASELVEGLDVKCEPRAHPTKHE